MLSGFDSSSTVRYEANTNSAYTWKLQKQIDCKKKETTFGGHFENDRWNVNHYMMKGQWMYGLLKGMKRTSEWHFNVRFLFSAWPCQLYADVFFFPQQTKSEMQVEFYVSDIQEVRNRFVLWSHLWHFPSHCATCKQPDRMRHGDLFSGSVFLSAFHFHPHPHFFFLICNHSDTCLTQHSLVAERYWRSTYSAPRMIYHTSPLFFPS